MGIKAVFKENLHQFIMVKNAGSAQPSLHLATFPARTFPARAGHGGRTETGASHAAEGRL